MPLLSKIIKRPRLNGIHDYLVPGPAGGEPPAGAAVESSAGEPAASGRAELSQGDMPALPEDGCSAAAAVEKEREAIESAVRQGFLQGIAEGKAEAEARSRELLGEASRRLTEAEQEAALCLKEARQRARDIVCSSEADIVELSVAIAEKLLFDQLEIAPRKVARIVQESLRHFPDEKEPLEVFLHPADLPVCRKELEQSAEGAVVIERLRLLPDELLPRGSCRIESGNGTAEYLLSEELKKIRETLLQIALEKDHREQQEEELAYASH